MACSVVFLFAWRMDRRRAITLLGAAFLAAACSPTREMHPRPKDGNAVKSTVETITYGHDPSQFGELSRPAGMPRGVVVVIHGGFWKAKYDRSLGQPLAKDLAARGWITWNLEYRRVGNGGGWPHTLDDVAAGIDKLADIAEVPTDKVITLGHSAGGHLAVWAAGRPGLVGSDWADPKVPVTAAISQAGVLDFAQAHKLHLGGGAAEALMGGNGKDRNLLADPMKQVPLQVPVWCVHGTSDTTVPISQSIAYVKAAKAAGAQAELIEVDGDHFVVIDPSSEAWRKTLGVLDSL